MEYKFISPRVTNIWNAVVVKTLVKINNSGQQINKSLGNSFILAVSNKFFDINTQRRQVHSCRLLIWFISCCFLWNWHFPQKKKLSLSFQGYNQGSIVVLFSIKNYFDSFELENITHIFYFSTLKYRKFLGCTFIFVFT